MVVIVPELLREAEPGLLDQELPGLQQLAATGSVCRIAPLAQTETPESLYLGCRPGAIEIADGPLVVSALGADPPDRSMQFHLSLMSLSDGLAMQPPAPPNSNEERELWTAAKRLDTRSLTLLLGEGLDHGLVWENVGDMLTTTPKAIEGQPIRAHLPEGDAEPLIRRLIDDSVNLLSELEFNQRRLDNDQLPLNLLWPWGQGVRPRLPNLALARGEPALVISDSMRMHGLARLVGYRHADRKPLGKGIHMRFKTIAEEQSKAPLSITLVSTVADLIANGLREEAKWFVRELDRELLTPAMGQEDVRLTILSPSATVGLAVTQSNQNTEVVRAPFDERAIDDARLAQRTVWELVAAGIEPSG